MMKKIATIGIVLSPAMAFAADGKGLDGVMDTLISLAGKFYNLILALIIVAFAWGILKFLFQTGEEQSKGKSIMI